VRLALRRLTTHPPMGQDMTNDSPGDPVPQVGNPTDRRKPVARYVEFGEEDIQVRFIDAAENAYQRLVASDQFDRLGHVELPAVEPPARRGLFRRPPPPPPRRVVPTTAALARVVQDTTVIPDEVQAAGSCASACGVANVLASVARELADDLMPLDPKDQSAHPAYRQTLRLAAELEGLRDIVTEVGCTDPNGCVGIRSPERWGRRAEDVEVAEVKAVLLRLALGGKRGTGQD
jgi:hypothetical protein